MNRMNNHSSRQAGFTLPEVLLSGVLGAMLLTALAYASAEFVLGIGHLEAKAGVGQTEDGILRQMTRDIREAWWAELPSSDHIKLANPVGEFTEYYMENGDLKIRRGNGDTATVSHGVAEFVMDAAYIERHRNGTLVPYNGTWYSRTASGISFNLELNGSEDSIAMGFVVPYEEGDLPGGSGTEEHLATASLSTLSVPLAFIPGTLPESLQVEIYAARAPGSATPFDTALATLSIDGISLPQAVDESGSWANVSTSTSLDLSSLALGLTPGESYTAVLTPTGDAGLLLQGFPALPSPDADDIDLKSGAGADYATMPITIPVAMSGNYDLTTTVVHNVVSTVSVKITPENRALQHRSAALLSQTLSTDPWFGVVPGELAP